MLKLHFHYTEADKPFLPYLKPLLNGRALTSLDITNPSTVMEIVINAKRAGAEAIATTSEKLLHLLLGKHGSIDKYAGSIIKKFGYEFLILDPVDHLIKVPYGKFLYSRFLSKLLDPSSWMQVPEFKWELFEPSQKDRLLNLFNTAVFISEDIETIKDDPDRTISCIGFTPIHFDFKSNTYSATNVVIPLTDDYNLAFTRTVTGLSIPKVLQNGKYDHAYLLRYNTITTNWCLDTINMFHAWYPELPKDLGLITAFCIRDWIYHKDESKTNDLLEYYSYNAKDAFVTAICCLTMLNEMPPWALDNYYKEFPLNFPCALVEQQGLKVDLPRMKDVEGQLQKVWAEEKAKLRIMVDNPSFNPGSWQQNQRVWEILGSGDIKGTGKIPMDKVASRHPLNRRIIGAIKTYKENKKLDSTYVDEEKVWHGRIYYALNPHGTDTTRLASKESQFWCGLQIQNIPRDTKNKPSIKQIFVSDDDFLFGESDYRQNEAWGAAFLSGDKDYIAAVSNPQTDFHSVNASKFFGLPYETVCKSVQINDSLEFVHERLLKDIIDIEKRVIYGVSYNMTAQVMLDTMGIDNVIRAKRLLNLDSSYSLVNVCQYLLNRFDETYPTVRGDFYQKITRDVLDTNFLISPRGHHRYCFHYPDAKGQLVKRDMNRYAAHKPQQLAAENLNEAYMNVFYRVWMPNQKNFKLGPQIHDSIFFQYRKGFVHLAYAVKKEMELTVDVTDTYGITRPLTVPVDLKGESNRWNELKSLR